jgi:cobalamin biosynthesis protein CobD/CbiB
MSAAAGVLGIQLDKRGHYELGFGQRKPSHGDIASARTVLWWTAAVAIILLSALIHLLR